MADEFLPTQNLLNLLEHDPEFRRMREESQKDGWQRHYLVGGIRSGDRLENFFVPVLDGPCLQDI